MNTLKLAVLSASLCVGLVGSAIGADMSKDMHRAEMDAIASKYKQDKAACDSLSGNAEDICSEEAKGREKVARAELEAKFSPNEKSAYNVSIARAEAAHDVAKEKCDDFSGNTKDVCVLEAKGAFVTASENARVAHETATAKTVASDKVSDVRKDAASEKGDADYAIAKEKCDALAGDAKAACLKAAEAKHVK